jgi:rsbT co-antagonist protein RsbR
MIKRNCEELCGLYGLTDQDFELISTLKDPANDNMNNMLKSWYKWLQTTPEFEEFFHDEDILKHAQKMQIEYWNQFFDAKVDDDYLNYRKKIGEVHARIGLPQDIYLAGVEHFSELILIFIDDMKMPQQRRKAIKRAVLKLVHLDLTTVVQSYEEMVNAKIASQSKAILEMSTPVTQLWSGLLLLPLVGIIDSQRAQDIMNSVLAKISETHAQSFILDISGVGVVDTAVANHLIKITKATRLMGCECIISGVSPAIAQTIVELGIDVGTIKTTANMKMALENSFMQMGMKIIEVKK